MAHGFDESGNPNGMNPDGATPAPKRRRWYLGIQSKKEPAHVMSEVYKALLVLHFEWQVVAPYRIKCRWQPKGFSLGEAHMSRQLSDGSNNPDAAARLQQMQAQSRIKIGLQLYKVQQHIYLLDFQRIDGNAFLYMNLCARIITELKTLSGIRPVADPRFSGMDHGGMGVGGGGGSHPVHHLHHQQSGHGHPSTLH